MPGPSSISSSELLEQAAWHRPRPLGSAWLTRVRTWTAACPRGPIVALCFGILVHAGAAVLCPEPVARVDLREKIRALTTGQRPSLIVAGDSRMECGVIPAQLAESLGLDSRTAVNLSETACDPSAFMAGFREFAPRFAPEPTIVLGISFFAVNDGATDILGDELLWSMDFVDRYRWVGLSRAVCTAFLPEKAVWQNLMRYWPSGTGDYPEAGFESVPGHANVTGWSAEHRRARAEALRKWWYSDLRTQGIRRQRLGRDLRRLTESGARLVVVLMPCHPAFLAHIAGTASGEADQAFQADVRTLCGQLGITCLEYDATCLGTGDPDRLFHDLVHLNRDGARAFTAALARDLAARGISAAAGSGDRSRAEQSQHGHAVPGDVGLE